LLFSFLKKHEKYLIYHVFYYIFMQGVSIPGDEPDWAGDWSPEGETGVSYPYWEGWQVQHVVLCESMGASDLFPPSQRGKVSSSKAPVWSPCVAFSINGGVEV